MLQNFVNIICDLAANFAGFRSCLAEYTEHSLSLCYGLWCMCDPVVFTHLQCGLEPRNFNGASFGSCWCRRSARRIGQI